MGGRKWEGASGRVCECVLGGGGVAQYDGDFGRMSSLSAGVAEGAFMGGGRGGRGAGDM